MSLSLLQNPKFVLLGEALLKADEARLPITDPSIHLGWNVTSSLLVLNGSPVGWSFHRNRIEKGCATLALTPQSFPTKLFEELFFASGAFQGRWRWKVGVLASGQWFGWCIPLKDPLPTARILVRQIDVCDLRPSFKTFSYAQRLVWRREAHLQGAEELLLSSEQGKIWGAALHAVAGFYKKTLFLPPSTEGSLSALWLQNVSTKLGYSIDNTSIPLHADLAILNAVQGIRFTQETARSSSSDRSSWLELYQELERSMAHPLSETLILSSY